MSTKNPPQVVTTPGTAWEKTLQTLYHNRRQIAMPCEDIQLKPWVATCDRCGDGLNEYEAEPDEWGHEYCPECREALTPKHDPETVAAVLEAYDREARKYLSEDICNAVWNAVLIKLT